MTANNLEVANTIRQQLGNMAFAMMGAKNLMGGEDHLTFKIGANAKKVTHITVKLDPSDTYTVTFHKVRGVDFKVLAEVSDVYVDSLHTTIEHHTGLYLSL